MSLFFFDFILHFVAVFFLVSFAVHFLDLKSHFHKYVKILYVMTAFMGISYTVYFFTDKSTWFIYGEFTGVLTLFLTCLSGFLMLKKSKFAIFFVIAYSLMILAFLLFAISVYTADFGIKIDLDFLKAASLIEMCTLTYGVSYRIKMLEKDKLAVEKDLHKTGKELTFFKEGYTKGKVSVNEQKLLKYSSYHHLTKQESRVLILLLKGESNNDTAEQLFISLSTVKFHIKNIYGKTGVSKRGGLLVSYAKFEV